VAQFGNVGDGGRPRATWTHEVGVPKHKVCAAVLEGKVGDLYFSAG